jgi:hypothetical protein
MVFMTEFRRYTSFYITLHTFLNNVNNVHMYVAVHQGPPQVQNFQHGGPQQ